MLDAQEYFALLDNMFWIKTEEINALSPTISDDRLATLNHYGYYLFILKLSHHLCRFPEENDRQPD
jgi:hypothetical protein